MAKKSDTVIDMHVYANLEEPHTWIYRRMGTDNIIKDNTFKASETDGRVLSYDAGSLRNT